MNYIKLKSFWSDILSTEKEENFGGFGEKIKYGDVFSDNPFTISFTQAISSIFFTIYLWKSYLSVLIYN